MSKFDHSSNRFSASLDDHFVVVRLMEKALDIVTDPQGNEEYYNLLDQLGESPEVWGYVQISDRSWNRWAAVEQFVEQLRKDPEFVSRGGRPYGYTHDLLTARFRNSLGRLLLAMSGSRKPVVAGMHGEISGEHLAYTLAYDARVATADTTFTFDINTTGIPASPGSTLLMPRYIGIGRTLSLLHSGATIEAREACSLGLISKVVESPDELVETCKSIIPASTANQRYLAAYHRQQILPPLSEIKLAIEAYIKAMTMWILQLREGS
jgi:enoyl-CoA hydratase/carnithine racemase